ncbi:YidC/Oxa1 family membrane protein insertase [Streptococcus tangpeifui]|uniref:YidC/Oxa1 family membrane protein insertase n=1 Tax=Streptococcus tangpeifui TaxID=2709400 RepID=UPI0013ECF852|nr:MULTISPECIES: YidC/Oxa1 family membrane protein insertase [unclassified Streptococcus]
MKKKVKLSGLVLAALIVLSACARRNPVNSSSTGWDQLVYGFGRAIQWLSFGGSVGIGIILFTLIVRLALIPLYNRQIKSSQEIQELQPELKRIQKEYADDRNMQAIKTQELYKENGVNQWAALLPLVIQFPVMMALYQALIRVPALSQGNFLFWNLGENDGTYILPILAAIFTYLSMWLSNKAAKEKNAFMTATSIIMPLFILWIGTRFTSGIALYWAIGNAFQVAQLLIFHNPFKIIAERERKEAQEKEREAKIRRAKKRARKKRK